MAFHLFGVLKMLFMHFYDINFLNKLIISYLFWACSITVIIHGWQPWDPSSTKWLRAHKNKQRLVFSAKNESLFVFMHLIRKSELDIKSNAL